MANATKLSLLRREFLSFHKDRDILDIIDNPEYQKAKHEYFLEVEKGLCVGVINAKI